VTLSADSIQLSTLSFSQGQYAQFTLGNSSRYRHELCYRHISPDCKECFTSGFQYVSLNNIQLFSLPGLWNAV